MMHFVKLAATWASFVPDNVPPVVIPPVDPPIDPTDPSDSTSNWIILTTANGFVAELVPEPQTVSRWTVLTTKNGFVAQLVPMK